MEDTRKYTLYRASKKTAKIDTAIDSNSNAMLMLWALQNTTKTKECVIFETESGLITDKVIGSEEFPTVRKQIQAERLYIEKD